MICDQGGSGIRFEGSERVDRKPSWLAEIQAGDPKILESSKIGPNEIHLYTNPAGGASRFLDWRQDP